MSGSTDARRNRGAVRRGTATRRAVGLIAALTAGTALAAGQALPSLALSTQAGLPGTVGRQVLAPYVAEWSRLVAQGGNATADLGPAAPGASVSAEVYLAGRDPAALARYAAAVSDPRSRLFHRYLTPPEVQASFGPTARQVAGVESWVIAAGMRVTDVTAHYVTVSGTAAEARRAFGAVWHSYQVDGTTQQSPPPGAALTAPESVAAAVLTVAPVQTGLPGYPATAGSVTRPRAATGTAPSTVTSPASATVTTPPCSTYYGQALATSLPDAYGRTAPYPICGYTAHQLRSAYGVPASLTGKGVTVAVVDPWRQQTAAQDFARFAAVHGQPLRPGQFTQILPAGLDASCEGTTPGPVTPPRIETPEVEAVHDMAPNADIVYAGAKCDDGDATVQNLDALTTVTDRDLASIVVCPWNVTVSEATVSPGLVASYEQVFRQGAAEGIGFYFGFRDRFNTPSGPGPAVEYPVSDPWVTSVGGTSLAIGRDGRYEWETGWGDTQTTLSASGTGWASLPGTYFDGSGGGTSALFRQPFYQRGIVPKRLSQAAGSTVAMRVTPDIAADGDDVDTRLVFGETTSATPGGPAAYRLVSAGGTSIACALIGGMQADAQQAAGTPVGFANPAIYARYGTAAYHDVTDHPLGPGSRLAVAVPAGGPGGGNQPLLVTLGTDQGPTATPGYDDVTGVGTPGPGYFASYRGR
jgi:subtilase family serine protease